MRKGMNFGMILDLLIMACGVYMVYWAVQMKSTNKIPEITDQVLSGKSLSW